MEEQEQLEWDDLNKCLERHGFKPVFFADPVEDFTDLVLLDKKSASEIRTTLKTMLTDSDRRQSLITELIQSNNQLKEETQKHKSRAAKYSDRADQLEALKIRIRDLEDSFLNKALKQLSQTQQLQWEKQEAQKHTLALETELFKKKKEASHLQRKLHFTTKEEEQRLARQNQVFKDICNKVCQENSPVDQQVMDVIEFYETKMELLIDELSSLKDLPERSKLFLYLRIKKPSSDVTPSFKTILETYKNQQEESRRQIEVLTREAEGLRQELETRRAIRELTCHKPKFQHSDGLNRHNNTWSLPGNKSNEISKAISDLARESCPCAYYHDLLLRINTLVINSDAPFRLHRQRPSSLGLNMFEALAPALEMWAQQLLLLKDLHKGLNKLSGRLTPWQPEEGDQRAAEDVKVEDMMLLVDTMLENTSTDDEKVLQSPSRHTLSSMVSHFQMLFDVTSLSGVFPRMNEVYYRLGEMTNIMRSLLHILQLDERTPPANVVSHVTRLASFSRMHHFLGDDDIDSIIVKVRHHEEFFPAFHALIVEILETLGVSNLEDILPTLKSLKQTAR